MKKSLLKIKNQNDKVCVEIDNILKSIEEIKNEVNRTFWAHQVKEYAYNIKLVPTNFLTKEMCELAVETNAYALYDIPANFLTHDLVKLAVDKAGLVVFDISKKYLTKEIIELANELYGSVVNESGLIVCQDGMALENVPNELRNFDICKIAYFQNQESIKYVPMLLKYAVTGEFTKRKKKSGKLDK